MNLLFLVETYYIEDHYNAKNVEVIKTTLSKEDLLSKISSHKVLFVEEQKRVEKNYCFLAS